MMNQRARKFLLAGCLAASLLLPHPSSRADDATTQRSDSDLLGDDFRDSTAGVECRAPADSRRMTTAIPDQLAEYDNDARHWVFKVRWSTLKNPIPLISYDDPITGHHDGLMDQAIQDIQQHPAAQILHKEVIHVGPDGKIPVAMMVVRYDEGVTSRLMQQAIVQANDRLYYVLQLDSPGRAGGASSVGTDPDEELAFNTFSAIVDSVHLLDRRQLYQDQVNRLIRTRALYANWTEGYLKGQLVPDRYFRIKRDGKDIGYTEQTEILDDGDGKISGVDVIKVGVRTFTSENGKNMAADSSYIVSVDRKHEEWISGVITKGMLDGKPLHASYHEVGVSDWRIRAVPAVAPGDALDAPPQDPSDAMGQPGVKMEDQYTLTVNIKSEEATLPKFQQALPPFYIPQCLDRLLPQILPYRDNKSYMFVTYVADGDNGRPAVMSEYVDVGQAENVDLDGATVVAVPIQEHIGVDGPVTTYYVNADDGSYLGSMANVVDADGNSSRVEIVPSDLATLKQLWPSQNQPAPAVQP